MSYSRWGESDWYTYMDMEGDFCATLADIGEYGLHLVFTREEINEDINKCLALAPVESREELSEFIQLYLDDVD
jgi:hypothetical protein